MNEIDARFLDMALEDQKDAYRWWYFCTLMTEPERTLLLETDKSEWDAMIDRWIMSYDYYPVEY